MKKNDVVSLLTLAGEFVGKFEDETPDIITLSDPHLVIPDNNNLGFQPVICMTGEPKLDKVDFYKATAVSMVPTAEPVVKEYRKATSGLIV